MDNIKETGGARIGMMNATWPFATLTVNKDRLEINAAIIGKLLFKPSDIISIEPYSGLFSSGIRINHTVKTYSSKVIFWSFSSSEGLIYRISETGFLNKNQPASNVSDDEILLTQQTGGFPIKIPVAIAFVVIWNVLFMVGSPFLVDKKSSQVPIGIGGEIALSFVVISCILLLVSEAVQKVVLKEGRNINDIKRFVYFLLFLTGFMLIVSTVLQFLKP